MNTENQKKIAAEKATESVQSGMIVGLGTGSTVYYALLKLGAMVREGLDIIGIPNLRGYRKDCLRRKDTPDNTRHTSDH